MNVGNDYLLLRSLRAQRWGRRLGIGLLALGVVLLLASGGYYLYTQEARSGLSDLVNQEPASSAATQQDVDLPGLNVPDEEAASTTAPLAFFIPASRFATLYPGQGIHPKYWASPQWVEEPVNKELVALLEGFRPVTSGDLVARGTLPPVTGILIPSINLDASIKELELLSLENALAWETPKNVVGHIPTSANAGEVGRGYFFGHLESPFKGEGSIFRRLPEIPEQLKNGEEVYVILSREDGLQYLYKVFSWDTGRGTEVVSASELRLTDMDEPVISLVTCVPRLAYSHRLIVNAEFVGIQQS